MHDPSNPNSISSNNIKCIKREDSGNLWIGTTGGGINYFNVKTKQFKRYQRNQQDIFSLHNNDVYALMIDLEENIFVGTKKGIEKLMKGNVKFEQVSSINDVLCLYEDRFGRIWAGVDDVGLLKYNAEKNIFEPYFQEYLKFCIRTMLFDSNDNLWVGGDNGLSFFNLEDSTFINYTRLDGLPTNLIMGILEDNYKNLWVSTPAGLVKCTGAVSTPDNFEIKIYTTKDGLQNKHFLNFSYYQNESGELFFGGVDGFTMFNPDSIKENQYAPRIAFTNLNIFNIPVKPGQKIMGKVILEKTINQCKEIALNYKHSIFSIEFAALHYAYPESNQYRYRMYPFEKEWNYSDASRRFATYTDLPHGKYIFMVNASNSDGVWSEESKNLIINILPPFWRTLWFKILIILAIFISGILYYYYKINLIRKQKEKLEILVENRTQEISEKNNLLKDQTKILESQKEELLIQKDMLKDLNLMKDKFFSIIAHDLKSPFQSIIGLSEILNQKFDEITESDKKGYVNAIYYSSKNVYDLLENFLCWARFQFDHLSFHPDEFDLSEIIDKTKIIYTSNIEKKNISITENYKTGTKVFADPNMIEIVIRNLLSNAIKFSNRGGKIEIILSGKSNKKLFSIRDNGIGMSQEEQKNLFQMDKIFSKQGTENELGTGLGLIICKEFVEKNGGEIWVESVQNKGATFYFTLTVGKRSSNT